MKLRTTIDKIPTTCEYCAAKPTHVFSAEGFYWLCANYRVKFYVCDRHKDKAIEQAKSEY